MKVAIFCSSAGTDIWFQDQPVGVVFVFSMISNFRYFLKLVAPVLFLPQACRLNRR